MKIKEALDRFNETSEKKKKAIDIGEILWPDSPRRIQQANIGNLMLGKTKSIKIEFVQILCEELQCDPNYLFDFEN